MSTAGTDDQPSALAVEAFVSALDVLQTLASRHTEMLSALADDILSVVYNPVRMPSLTARSVRLAHCLWTDLFVRSPVICPQATACVPLVAIRSFVALLHRLCEVSTPSLAARVASAVSFAKALPRCNPLTQALLCYPGVFSKR
jgi:hypothetical protein